MISVAAEYYYCFEGWLTDPGSSYVFMILCVAVQTACIEFVCFSLGVGHRVVVMLAASLVTGAVLLAFQMMFTGFSGRIKLKGVQ